MRRRRDPFDLFRDFDEIFNQMIKEMEAAEPKMGTETPFIYGFSYSQRPGEEPEVREFGNVYPGKTQMEIGERRPLIDVFDTEDTVHIVAEMPGIEKEDVDLDVSGRELLIKASRGPRSYNETVELPANVDLDSAKATYKNGVLEVTLKKEKRTKSKKRINVE
ncbi:Hsp20/alpha crystallin family protein [Methanocella sp. CWC-04]|uniref:Hsp20/alpha crystallin family protein n=1 Tax=Methanooceanicella nereidis TaxID=2052831 RepID=A0AAP2W6X1_9EURY|nr:archaeal heat shock protein Hsp20 [Methanocella sp. CWC-04]MCD1294536.1 Hsp20/alpha crystallin family protein [Methanocella sp. CWC-04]